MNHPCEGNHAMTSPFPPAFSVEFLPAWSVALLDAMGAHDVQDTLVSES